MYFYVHALTREFFWGYDLSKLRSLVLEASEVGGNSGNTYREVLREGGKAEENCSQRELIEKVMTRRTRKIVLDRVFSREQVMSYLNLITLLIRTHLQKALSLSNTTSLTEVLNLQNVNLTQFIQYYFPCLENRWDLDSIIDLFTLNK